MEKRAVWSSRARFEVNDEIVTDDRLQLGAQHILPEGVIRKLSVAKKKPPPCSRWFSLRGNSL